MIMNCFLEINFLYFTDSFKCQRVVRLKHAPHQEKNIDK
jgi:hypothetical protein